MRGFGLFVISAEQSRRSIVLAQGTGIAGYAGGQFVLNRRVGLLKITGTTLLSGNQSRFYTPALYSCGYRQLVMLAQTMPARCQSRTDRSHGYDSARPGAIYCVAGRKIVKFGISNITSLDRRINKHVDQGCGTILFACGWENGCVAPMIEKRWKSLLSKSNLVRVSRLELPDGHSEATKYCSEIEDELLKIFGDISQTAHGAKTNVIHQAISK
jgi:hypothetical protein